MTHALGLFSKILIYLIASGGALICAVLFPELARESIAENPASTTSTYFFLAGSYLLFIPFFIGLYFAHKFLGYLGSRYAFTAKPVTALRAIKYCVLIFSVLVAIEAAAMIVTLKSNTPSEDVTHLIVLAGVTVFTSTTIALSIAVLQRLFQDAINIKEENDLIV